MTNVQRDPKLEKELRAAASDARKKRAASEEADARRARAIRKAREAGYTFAAIGELIGLTRQRVEAIDRSSSA